MATTTAVATRFQNALERYRNGLGSLTPARQRLCAMIEREIEPLTLGATASQHPTDDLVAAIIRGAMEYTLERIRHAETAPDRL